MKFFDGVTVMTHMRIIRTRVRIPKDIKNFEYSLKLKYAVLMSTSISKNLLMMSLRYLRSFMLFFIYGLIDLISLKTLRFSFISKFFKKN